MRLSACLFLCASVTFAQTLLPGLPGEALNANEVGFHQTSSNSKVHKSVTFTGDTVIPQVVDGAGWKTTFIFHNLESKSVHFKVRFFTDGGKDLILAVPGLGSGRGIDITLASAGTAMYETEGSATALSQGWAYIEQDNYEDSIAAMAVFRARSPGRADQEAVVPVVSQFSSRFVLVYDNTQGYVTSMAVANPSSLPAAIDVIIRDQAARILKQDRFTLGAYEHQAFSTAATWPDVANKRGSIEFRITNSSFGIGVLGLRFHPTGSFTSFQTLANINWVVNQ